MTPPRRIKLVLVLYLTVTAACASPTEVMRDDADPSVAEFSCNVNSS